MRAERPTLWAAVAVVAAASLAGCRPPPTGATLAATLEADTAYPAVQRPSDIFVDPSGDKVWALVRGPQGVGLAHGAGQPATFYQRVIPGSLTRHPSTGQPLFFSRTAGHDASVGMGAAAPLPERIVFEMVVPPLHAGEAATPVYTTQGTDGLRLRIGDSVGPLSETPPLWASDRSGKVFAHRYVQDGETWIASPDGQKLGPFESATSLKLSPDGSSLAFLFHRAGKAYVYLDGREVGGWEGAPAGALFSENATGFIAIVALSGGKMGLATAERVYGPYDTVENTFAISADGRQVAFLERQGTTSARVVTAAGPGPVMRNVFQVTFSPDGRRLAYHGIDAEGRAALWLDGKVHSIPADLDRGSFRFDQSQRLVFTVQHTGRTDLYDEGVAGARLAGSAAFVGRIGERPILAGFDRERAAVAVGQEVVRLEKICDSVFADHVRVKGGEVRLVCRKGGRLNHVRIASRAG